MKNFYSKNLKDCQDNFFVVFDSLNHKAKFGNMYKPRGQTRGEGVAQMTTILNNSYLVKISTGGGQNCQKFCPRGLYMSPYELYLQIDSMYVAINLL